MTEAADAARCRSEADWLIGLNATRATTCRVRDAGGDQLLSVGRVQTPTLALIVQRDEDIANFVSEKFWRVTAEFQVPTAAGEAESAAPADPTAQQTDDANAAESQSDTDANAEEMPSTESALLSSWTGKYFNPSIAEALKTERQGKDAKEEKDGKESGKAERLSELQTATAIAEAVKEQTGSIVQATKKRKTERTPLLYDLNELQKRANQRYGFSAQRTLDIAQAMYEQHKLHHGKPMHQLE